MIGIINYIGNIGSVKNALDYLEIPNCIVNIPEQLKDCTHIIIPGVGNWTEGVKKLNPFYKYLKSTDKPILGICLGFQLMAEESEEGKGNGLGLIPLKVTKLPKQHVGWDYVGGECYYFTHGYSMGYNMIVHNPGLVGVQFHPEKSQTAGLKLLKQFYEKDYSSIATS
jgi:glutamine amidotransferase